MNKLVLSIALTIVLNCYTMKRQWEPDIQVGQEKICKFQVGTLVNLARKSLVYKLLACNTKEEINGFFDQLTVGEHHLPTELIELFFNFLWERLDDNRENLLLKAIKQKNVILAKYLIENLNAPIKCKDKNGNTPLIYAAQYLPNIIELILSKGAKVDENNENNMTALSYAAIHNAESLSILLKNGANINSRDFADGMSPLIFAIVNKNFQAIDELLKAKARVNQADIRMDCTPLMYAAMYFPEAIQMLIHNGANTEAVDDDGWNALIYAIRRGSYMATWQLLFSRKVQVNIIGEFGYTPLMLAVRYQPDSVKLLLEYGANPNVINNFGETAHSIAYDLKKDEIAQLIKQAE